jgi:hypothetical protein
MLRARILGVVIAVGIVIAAFYGCSKSYWPMAKKRRIPAPILDASIDRRTPDAAAPPCPTVSIPRPPLTGAGHVAIARQPDGGASLARDGAPYFIRGAGGEHRLDLASSFGANSTRTWGSERAKEKLDAAASVSMTVLLGVWLDHDGTKYVDEHYRNGIRAEVKGLLDSVASHPALLMWSIGNEINQGADTKEAWTFVDELAKTIRASDPHHPIATVISGPSLATLNNIADFAPSIGVVGLNAYGGIVVSDGMVQQSRFTGPYMFTEWGPNGFWEAALTSWGRPFEPTSSQKADTYKSRYDLVTAHPDRCIGSYVFLWGQKQERTPTWFSMFVEENADLGLCAEACPTTDVMAYAWGGKTAWPANRSPTVSSLSVAGLLAPNSIVIAPNDPFTAIVVASDPDGDDVRFVWELLEEPTLLGTGGSSEGRPPRVGNPVFGRSSRTFTAPAAPGEYRLFVYVLDGHGHAGTANLPLLVRSPP